ncbi:MAG: FAD binding domain-containing protein, partial [Acidiferrobacterales bacterium]
RRRSHRHAGHTREGLAHDPCCFRLIERRGGHVMYDFTYHRPTSVSAATDALTKAGDGKPLAGGMSLIPTLKLRLAKLTDLVDLAAIADLKGVKKEKNAIVIGAMTTHADVAASKEVNGAIPALAVLANGIGDAQVRNRGTLGGSLAHADPAADYPAAIVGLGATVHTDKRQIAGDDFFTRMFETVLEDGEIITAVSFPIPERAGYAKFPNPASRYPIVGVMVSSGTSGIRVAVTGAGASVFRVPEMEKALASNFAPVALDGLTVAADGLNTDLHASAEYRAHLVTVMAKRAVVTAR